MSTLLNALFTAGGPDATGSMRTIEVKRGGKVVTTFDMYDMLLKGDKSRDIPLQDGDVVYVPQVASLVAITGDVKRPAIFEVKGQASVADAIAWAGGFSSTADTKQVIVEKNVNNDFKTIATLPSATASEDPGLAALPLSPADVIRVFSPSSVAVAASISNEYVSVAGEVKQTGAFQIREGETLRGLIARLGVTDKAYIFATEVSRESVRVKQQEKLDEVAQRFMSDLETGSSQQMAATTDQVAVAALAAAVERQRTMAQRMATVKSTGRIVLELADGDAQVKNLPDLALRDGDTIYVPRKPDTVGVLGAVFQQNSFIYRPSRTVNDYVNLAGGANQTADKSQMYVIRADGTTQSGSNAGWFSGVSGARINPGDSIVIPEEIPHTSWTQTLKEWTSIFYQFGLGAAGLKVLRD
jgi:protein involved in polysaccharide export with SLBB domain